MTIDAARLPHRRRRSWPTRRAVDRDGDRPATDHAVGIDTAARRIVQPDGLGLLRESAFLARLDECKTAIAAGEEVGGAGGIGQPGRGAGEEDEAWLMVAGGGSERLHAPALAHDPRQRRTWK